MTVLALKPKTENQMMGQLVCQLAVSMMICSNDAEAVKSLQPNLCSSALQWLQQPTVHKFLSMKWSTMRPADLVATFYLTSHSCGCGLKRQLVSCSAYSTDADNIQTWSSMEQTTWVSPQDLSSWYSTSLDTKQPNYWVLGVKNWDWSRQLLVGIWALIAIIFPSHIFKTEERLLSIRNSWTAILWPSS